MATSPTIGKKRRIWDKLIPTSLILVFILLTIFSFYLSATLEPLVIIFIGLANILGISVALYYASVVHRSRNLLHYHMTHDAMTGLLNRKEFEKALVKVHKIYNRTGKPYVLGYLDIDNLQMLNEATSYLAGDNFLRSVAELLRKELNHEYILARLGGDEFGILAPQTSAKTFKKIAYHLISVINALHFNWEKRVYRMSASMGLAIIHKQINSLDKLLNEAELACNTAKKEGGLNRVFMFQTNQHMILKNYQTVVLAHDIHEAINKNRLLIYMQKIISTQFNQYPEHHHYEVLLRMLDQHGEIIQADVIIPIAERFNLITKIDRWVVTQLLEQYDKTLNGMTHASFNINISAISLSDPEFLTFLLSSIKKSLLPPHQLCFEITETAMMSKLEKTQQFVLEISRLGCKIALDDFGVGLSSFSYLQNFKVDYMKIDGSFVKQAIVRPTDWTIVQMINEMAHCLNIKTIAEYVESPEILQAMEKIGVDYVQGFAIDKPKPLSEVFLSGGGKDKTNAKVR